MKLKELSKNLLLLFVSLLIFFLFLEMGVRIFSPESKRINQFHEVLGVTLIPNITFENQTEEFGLLSHQTNSLGFVDSEHKFEKNEEIYRIVVLGDSWAEATQVSLDKTFRKILEKRLNDLNTDKKFEVISLGCTGYDTNEEYLSLEEIGFKYNPDLVILTTFAGNDIFYNSLLLSNEPGEPYFDLENGSLKQVQYAKAISHGELISLINKYFRSPRFLYKKFQLLKRGIDSLISQFSNWTDKEAVVGSLNPWYVYKRDYDFDWEKTWQITEALIEKMRDDSKKRNADFLLINIPSPFEINPELWNNVLNQYPSMKKLDWDLEKPNRIFKDFSKEKNIYYLDLFSSFREYVAKTGQELYDDHFNSNGHRLMAELIYNFLMDNNLIKTKL